MDYEDNLQFDRSSGYYRDTQYDYPISRTPALAHRFDTETLKVPDPLRTSTIVSTASNLTLRSGDPLGVVDCGSWYMERTSGTSVQTVNQQNNRIQFNTIVRDTFPAGSLTVGNSQTFTNSTTLTLTLLISASIRGIWTGPNGSFGLWIARSAGTVRFAQTVLSPITNTGSNEAHSTLTCLQLNPGESFSVFMSCVPDLNIGHANDNFRKCSITIRYLP